VFDDTIEHEAWNESDKLRVVLIFDIWHPHLTPPERALITALTAGVNAFSGGSGGADLKGSKRSFPQCCRFCSSQPSIMAGTMIRPAAGWLISWHRSAQSPT
jgi:hypothetical protein